MAAMPDWFASDPLKFASDATLTAVVASILFLIAVLATFAEQRRNKREQIEQVGWMPWTPIALGGFFAGSALFMLAVKSLLAS